MVKEVTHVSYSACRSCVARDPARVRPSHHDPASLTSTGRYHRHHSNSPCHYCRRTACGHCPCGKLGPGGEAGFRIGRKSFQQAGTAEERADDLRSALLDDEVKAIWCARGGYGTVHLTELVDLSILQDKPKWIVGFSDVTVLHSALHRLGVCSLHAQMPFNITGKSEACISSLKAALFGNPEPVSTLGSNAHSLDRHGSAEGVVVGGNVSILYALRGTPYDRIPREKSSLSRILTNCSTTWTGW